MVDRADDGERSSSKANASDSVKPDPTEVRTSVLQQRIQRQLQSRTERGIRRQLTRFDPTPAEQPETIGAAIDSSSSSNAMVGSSFAAAKRCQQEARWIDFSSNDYLSFATSDELKQGYLNRLRTWHASNPNHPLTSSGGSRLLDGNLSLSEEVRVSISPSFSYP